MNVWSQQSVYSHFLLTHHASYQKDSRRCLHSSTFHAILALSKSQEDFQVWIFREKKSLASQSHWPDAKLPTIDSGKAKIKTVRSRLNNNNNNKNNNNNNNLLRALVLSFWKRPSSVHDDMETLHEISSCTMQGGLDAGCVNSELGCIWDIVGQARFLSSGLKTLIIWRIPTSNWKNSTAPVRPQVTHKHCNYDILLSVFISLTYFPSGIMIRKPSIIQMP